MYQESSNSRVGRRDRQCIRGMNFLSQMEVRRDRMLEKLRKKIAAQEQQHRNRKVVIGQTGLLPDQDSFRKDLEEGDSQHKAGTEGEKIPQTFLVSGVNFARKQDESAENISGRCEHAKEQELKSG